MILAASRFCEHLENSIANSLWKGDLGWWDIGVLISCPIPDTPHTPQHPDNLTTVQAQSSNLRQGNILVSLGQL